MSKKIETMDDIIEAALDLPIEAFAAQGQLSKLREILRQRTNQYFSSTEYKRQLAIQARKNDERRKREVKKAKTAETWAKHHVCAGDFIRVKGARDGHGVREVISVESDRLVCRAYGKGYGNISTHKDGVILGGKLFVPRAQMTDHMYNKVTHKHVECAWQKVPV